MTCEGEPLGAEREAEEEVRRAIEKEDTGNNEIPEGIVEAYSEGNTSAADTLLEKWPALARKSNPASPLTFAQASANVQLLVKKRNDMTNRLLKMQDD